MESKDCIWLLHSLWRAGLLFPPKIPLLDTLLCDSSSTCGLKWLFMDKKGHLKRKHQDNCSYERVMGKFTQDQERDAVVASLITKNEFRPMTVYQVEEFLAQGHLSVGSALQLFRRTNVDVSRRYTLSLTVDDHNLPHFRYESVQTIDSKKQTTLLTAQSICQFLRETEKEVRTAIESHNKCKVQRLKLVFLPDPEVGAWLMGCEECVISVVDPLKRRMRTITPSGTEADENNSRAKLRTSSSVRKPPVAVRKEAKLESQHSIMSNTSTSHLAARRRNKCPGDFCRYVLAVPQPLKKTEADVDELVAKIKRVNSSEGQKETTKFRLGLAADFLQREREKLQSENMTGVVSTRYLLLGKRLLASIDEVPEGQEVCEIDLTNMLKHTDLLRDASREFDQSTDFAQASAFHFYSDVPVCERCYSVYSLIRMATMKEFEGRGRRMKSAMPRLRRTATTGGRSGSPVANVGKDSAGCYVSPLGKMHKHSINDMLADIGYQKAESELEQGPNALKLRLLELYKGMTVEEHKRTEELRKLDEIRHKPLLEAKLRDPGSVDEMGRKLFPASSRAPLSVVPSAEKGLTKWKNFLKNRRRKSRDGG